MDALARLWCHCESKQRRDLWTDATSEMIEGVCLWEGEPGLLTRHLVACRWLDELPDGGYRIHGWAEANARMIQAWDTWKVHNERRRHDPSNPRALARVSHDTRTSVARVSHDTRTKVVGHSQPSPSSPTPDPSVQVHQQQGSFEGGTGGGGAPAPKGSASPLLSKKQKHVRWAALNRQASKLRAEQKQAEEENERFPKEKRQELERLEAELNRITEQQSS